jgi:hypothetical protein
MKQAALNKLLHDTLKQSAKEHDWKYSRGFAFKATDLLFFSLIVVGQVKRLQLSCSLRCKLLAFDDLFWKIMGMEENSQQPLSFRAFGAWTAPTETISDVTLPVTDWDPTNLKSRVDELFVRSEADAANVTKQISNVDDNLCVVEELFARLKDTYPDAVTNVWVERLLTSVLKHDYERAEGIILDRRNAHDYGGFQVGSKSFYDLAHEYIRALS